MKTIFKKGQTVWCLNYGEGVVQSIRNGAYPIYVVFTNGEQESYTNEGSITREANRSLFFSCPKIEAETAPKFVPTLENKVLVIKGWRGMESATLVLVINEDENQMTVRFLSGEGRGHTTLKKGFFEYVILEETAFKKFKE